MTIPAGTTLGPYEIVELRGKGGMGEVYAARDTRLDRDVAIKVLPERLSDDEDFRRRFEREAKTISQLSHPNVCTLFDVGSHEGREYLVMELLEGETLEQRLKRGALPLEELLRVGAQIAEGIEAAHRHGVVHRDLKPGNVMLTPTGAKVLDFGLAKGVASGPAAPDTQLETATPLTTEGAIIGTLHYMAPEQLEGREADRRSDLFALGSVLYEMATGERPFRGASQASVIAEIMKATPEPLSVRQPEQPVRLQEVIERCHAKDPERRWQSARDVSLELERVTPDRASAEVQAGRSLAGRSGFVGAGVVLGILASFLWRTLSSDSTSSNKTERSETDQAPDRLAKLDSRSRTGCVHSVALTRRATTGLCQAWWLPQR